MNGGNEILECRCKVAELKQSRQSHHPEQSEISADPNELQQRGQDGDEIDQTRKAKNVIKPFAQRCLSSEITIIRCGPNSQDVFNREKDHRNNFENQEL